jgi:hypothetical protein
MATAINTVAGSAAIPSVDMPNPANTPRKRTQAANAFSVNEPGEPLRTGGNAQALAASLGKIVAFLAPDDATHVRYQPTVDATFCNIYAHDYCHLAGVYLPRVWWMQSALAKLAAGGTVTPDLGVTIGEMTANALVPWFKQFGPTSMAPRQFARRAAGPGEQGFGRGDRRPCGVGARSHRRRGAGGRCAHGHPECRWQGDDAAAEPGRQKELQLRISAAELVAKPRRVRLLDS